MNINTNFIDDFITLTHFNLFLLQIFFKGALILQGTAA